MQVASCCEVYLGAAVASTHKDKSSLDCLIDIRGNVANERIADVLIDVVERSSLTEAVQARRYTCALLRYAHNVDEDMEFRLQSKLLPHLVSVNILMEYNESLTS